MIQLIYIDKEGYKIMGIVNDYISKLMSFIKNEKYDKSKPWLKYYGDMPEHLSYFSGSLYDALKISALTNERRIAYRYFGLEVSYRSFLKKIDKIASALKQFNIVENECVTMCLPNSPESFLYLFKNISLNGIDSKSKFALISAGTLNDFNITPLF